MEFLLLILGFIILIVGGNLLVKGGVELAGHFKISKLVVGITIISLGTSAPELFVSISAALKSSPDISFGNVIGSNIANIGLVLGLTALILPVPANRTVIVKDWPFMMIASILLLICVQDLSLSYIEGLIFLIILILYIYWSLYRSRKKTRLSDQTISPPKRKFIFSLFILIIAAFALFLGSELLINSARNIALDFGISERLIGLSLVAFGTSVPELATSIIAALKKQMDISVGNIIGSNIFNILAILGITSIIKSINISLSLVNFDIYAMLAIAVLLLLFLLPVKKSIVKRHEGAFLLLFYIAYMYYIFMK